MTKTYEVRVEGASEQFEAATLEAAIEYAKGWLAEGDWEPIESTIWVHGLLYEEDEVLSHRVTATIDPPEPKCAPLEGQEHDWRSPFDIVGGCKEAPGVFGHGGGVIIEEVCVVCGCARFSDTWAQDPETGRQGLHSVRYEPGKYRHALDAREEDE